MADQIDLSRYRDNYRRVFASEMAYFFCPVLHVDEPCDVIRGHVVPQSIHNCSNVWVPQRKDVDGVFGVSIQPDCAAAFRFRTHTGFEILNSATASRTFRPRLSLLGNRINFYKVGRGPDGRLQGAYSKHHTLVDFQIAERQNTTFAFDLDCEQIGHLNTKHAPELNYEIDFDYRFQLIGQLWHSAHLTMFHMMMYEYVETTAYALTRELLFNCFEDAKRTNRKGLGLARDHFQAWENYVMPLDTLRIWSKGTVDDGRFLIWQSIDNKWIGLGIIVRVDDEWFVVWLRAGCADTSAQYVALTKEVPQFWVLRSAEFHRNETGDGEIHIEPQAHRIEMKRA